VGDTEAVAAFRQLTQFEGILPALESAHAVAYALQKASRLSSDKILLVCLSGRGDKDLASLIQMEKHKC